MSKTTVFLVILFSFLIGVGIFFLTSHTSNSLSLVQPTNSQKSTPTPTPKPTLSPLAKDANLKEEINNSNLRDYSEEFSNLKKEVNSN